MLQDCFDEADKLKEKSLEDLNKLDLDDFQHRRAINALNHQWIGLRSYLGLLDEERYTLPLTLDKMPNPIRVESDIDFHLQGAYRHYHNLKNLPNIIKIGEDFSFLMDGSMKINYEELESGLK